MFWRAPGIYTTAVGYSAGFTPNPSYQEVCTGRTGHNEVVLAVFETGKASYEDLLKIFWEGHDPTQGMRQGNDVGTQYRSAIFYANPEQKDLAQRYIAQLDAAKAFRKPIVTEVAPLDKFYAAEDYHQNYLALHPDQPYIVYNDLPKLHELKKQFPAWYKP